MKNLKVIVVPVLGNEIDQNSSVDEILSANNIEIVTVGDYFKGQNDMDFDYTHWSFLIDMDKMIDLTGIDF